jgi:uncharacterized membrane protein YGL010W
MKSAIEQLSTYKSVHLNKKNIQTHFIGVPLIIFSIAMVLATLSFDINATRFDMTINFSLATVVAISVLFYYLLLSPPLALLALILFGPIVYGANYAASVDNHLFVALTIFIVGWVIQFIGHFYEKAKPAFVDDLNQLLIGPLFLIAEIYQLLGFDRALEEAIREKAIAKRRIFEQQKDR